MTTLRAWLWPLVTAVGGLLVSGLGALWLQTQAQRHAEDAFERSVARVVLDIRNRFERPLYGLSGLRGVYAARESVDAESFRAFVGARDLPREFPGVRGFGFIRPLAQADWAAYQTQVRAEGVPDFALRRLSDGGPSDLLVIRHVEPAARNLGAQGLDVGSEPIRRAGAEQALRSGKAALSGVISLVQDEHRSPGMLLYLPLPGFAAGQPPRGLLYAPLVMSELLADLDEVVQGQLQLDVRDGAGAEGALMLRSGPVWEGARLRAERRVDLHGRSLSVRARGTPAFEASHQSWAPLGFFVACAGASLVLAALLRQQTSGRQRAEGLALGMSVELERLALVARRTTNAVHMTDAQRRIAWVNEGFERMTGYGAAEAIGRYARELLQTLPSEPGGDLGALDRALTQGESFCGEVRICTRDGAWLWLAVDVQAVRDATGALGGFISVANDISHQKQVEAELERERVSLRNIIEGTDVGTWEWQVETGEVRLNERWAAMLGYSLAELEPVNAHTWERLAHPDDLQAARVRLAEHFGGGAAYECVLRMRHRLGHWVWVQARGKLFSRGPGGAPGWMAGTHQDVSARHALEQALRQKTELLDTVLESLPCGLSVFDTELNLLLSNRAYRRLLDFPDALFEGGTVPFERFIRFNAERGEYGSGDVETTIHEIVARARGPALPHQFERRRHNGIVLEVHGGPMPGGGFVTTYTDVSSRRQAEDEARRAGDLLRHAIDALDEAFVLYDPDDRLVLCNDKYRQIYPMIAELMQPGVRFEDLVRAGAERGEYTEAIGRVDAWVTERVALHRAANSTVVQQLADGRCLRIVERRLPDGHIVGFRIDISELMRVTEAAQQASQAKSRFVANMSHEIRTPMNAILGLLALLQRTELNTRQADYVHKTEHAARSLLGLLNDILDFSKVEAGKLELDPQPFELEGLFAELAVVMAANQGDKPVELLFDIEPHLPARVVGDVLRLRQVLLNLLGNALKFTERGEVVLRVHALAAPADPVALCFEVRDTGIGIAPEHQDRIFSGFTQAEASTTRRFGGTGLGLAISQRLVALMGGTLRLHSALGEGSRFEFQIQLPVAEPAGRAEGTGRSLGLLSARPELARMLQHWCTAEGWQVLPVSELGAPGLHAQAWLIDADGQEDAVYAWLQTRPAVPQQPLVLLCSASHRDAWEARLPGEARPTLLSKPLTPGALRAALAGRAAHRPPVRAGVQRLQKLRVLLVEDNPINQQVAMELLALEGAQVQLARHGLEALTALRAAPEGFDAVLMDVQMPVMDGYTATRAIREELGLRALPILAMTANALPVDRAACLAAGMNAHVGKPFDLDELIAALRQHGAAVVPAARSAAPRFVPPELTPEQRQRAAALALDLDAALERFMGRTQLYARACASLQKSATELEALWHQAEPDAEPEALAQSLHGLKGLAAMVGATGLVEPLRALEQQAHQGQRPDPSAMQALLERLNTLAAAVAALALELSPAQPADAVLDRVGLPELAQLLVRADMAALQAHAEWRARQPVAAAPRLQALDEAMASLDFERAAAALAQL